MKLSAKLLFLIFCNEIERETKKVQKKKKFVTTTNVRHNSPEEITEEVGEDQSYIR